LIIGSPRQEDKAGGGWKEVRAGSQQFVSTGCRWKPCFLRCGPGRLQVCAVSGRLKKRKRDFQFLSLG
jgi:hypothetical protein